MNKKYKHTSGKRITLSIVFLIGFMIIQIFTPLKSIPNDNFQAVNVDNPNDDDLCPFITENNFPKSAAYNQNLTASKDNVKVT
ncbi:MAG: hypothetical protein ACTSUK_10035, partial [Promethearchaeota archaeon]